MKQFLRTAVAFAAFFIALLPALKAQTSTEARGDWYNSNYSGDLVMGVGVDQSYEQLLVGRSPSEIIVAIIDSGVDYDHEDLADVMWVNADEIPDNGIDDDGNGYIDDIHGWSFISGPGGDVHHDNLEFTRVLADLEKRFKGKSNKDIAKADRDDFKRYQEMSAQYESRVSKAKEELQEFENILEFYSFAKTQMEKTFGGDDYTVEEVKALESEDEMSVAIRDFMVYALENDFESELDAGMKHYKNTVNYSYNKNMDSRNKVGDNPDDISERYYGTNRVEGPAAEHGTHVAGIVAAIRGNNLGIDGVASAARIMAIRAVPDGDERDKDVANAIRYAVDNGAKIINMSFGKSYSPDKVAVDEAVRYAESKGVLLIHAAGNSSNNNDKSNNFPNPVYEDTRELCTTWIEVGASGPSLDRLVASFTNYGRKSVDIFAPGVDINSTVPGDEYQKFSGTSMASPVVAGVAALVWSYFPDLTAKDLREILVNSYTDMSKVKVTRPGGKKPKKVPFKKLSRTGGIVNAYNALKMAMDYESKR